MTATNEALARRFAPQVCFHSRERFFPTTFENILEHSSLHAGKDHQIIQNHPTARDLTVAQDDPRYLDDIYLQMDPDETLRVGSPLGDAPMYVYVRRTNVTKDDIYAIDIVYVMCFAHRGPFSEPSTKGYIGDVTIRTISEALKLPHHLSLSHGRYDCDFQHTCIRITRSATCHRPLDEPLDIEDYVIDSVFYGTDNGSRGCWRYNTPGTPLGERPEFNPKSTVIPQVRVYVAINSHHIYPEAAIHVLQLGIMNDYTNREDPEKFWTNTQDNIILLDPQHHEPAWIAYRGKMNKHGGMSLLSRPFMKEESVISQTNTSRFMLYYGSQ